MKRLVIILILIQSMLILGCSGKDIASKCIGKDTINGNIDSICISETRNYFQFSRDSVAVLDQLYFTNESFKSVLEQLINRKGGQDDNHWRQYQLPPRHAGHCIGRRRLDIQQRGVI